MSRHLDLMRLHDGELDPEAAAELEQSLTEEDRQVLAGLEQLGDVLGRLERGEVKRFEGVADSVMSALEQPSKPAEVVPLRPEAPPSRRSAGRGPVVAAGLTLAAAAALLLWVGTPAEGPSAPQSAAVTPTSVPERRPELPPPAPEPVVELVEDDVAPAASIEAVDFGNQGGSIFMVPAGDESTPVVWLVEEPAGARMEPL